MGRNLPIALVVGGLFLAALGGGAVYLSFKLRMTSSARRTSEAVCNVGIAVLSLGIAMIGTGISVAVTR